MPIFEIIDIVPIPANSPVINRLVLLLSLLKNACIVPSKYVGIIKSRESHTLRKITPKAKSGKEK